MPGGSSSGSAVATARGIVSFALGTDTAGSGRIPAGLNNIVGLKPTVGALSAAGVVPACRTLDCVSIFALTVADAYRSSPSRRGMIRPIPIRGHFQLRPLAEPPPAVTIGVPPRATASSSATSAMRAGFEAALADA